MSLLLMCSWQNLGPTWAPKSALPSHIKIFSLKGSPLANHQFLLDLYLFITKKMSALKKEFLNKLKSLRAGLQEIISFGTDGEMALVNALQSCFPKGTEKSLHCFRHFRQNVEAMLNKACIKGTTASQYLWEIFGKVSSDGCYETGLLDS